MGETYGAGDGTSTFNLPNTQGVFIRGAGSQTIGGITYTGTMGTVQGDQMQGHKHMAVDPSVGLVHNLGFPGGAASFVNTYGSVQNGITQTGVPISDGSNGTPRTGDETHPANISLTYIIKI